MTSNCVSLPQGFRAAGVACGIKAGKTNRDLCLFVSDTPAASAGVFTQNCVCGAPVKISRERILRATTRAVILNSGNANAATGDRGLDDASWMTAEVASLLDCDPLDVLVCSTGVIGRFLPRERLAPGFPAVVASLTADDVGFSNAAQAMMTTDTVPKQSVHDVLVGGKPVRVSGAAKGAAMIRPNMATMLSVIMTDARLTPDQCDSLLRSAVDDSFNCISVEGHTSTSDSVILLANGAAGTGAINGDELTSVHNALTAVCLDLAQAIIRDAEGADHFITIEVTGLRSRADARRIAGTIADDALVKTAITGADPNWGRIVSACGRTGVDLTEQDITLHMNGTLIYDRGTPTDYSEAELSEQMRTNRDVLIRISFPFGSHSIRFWTSDLTQEYVRLNSEYTT